MPRTTTTVYQPRTDLVPIPVRRPVISTDHLTASTMRSALELHTGRNVR